MDPINARSREIAKRQVNAEPTVRPETAGAPSDQFVSRQLESTPLDTRVASAEIQAEKAPPKDRKKETKASLGVSSQPASSAILMEQSEEAGTVQPTGKTLAQLAAEVTEPKRSEKAAPLEQPPLSPGRRAGILRRLGHGFLNFLTSDPLQPFQRDLKAINAMEKSLVSLKTPAQFQAKTAEFKTRLAHGESLADIRVEAYAVARQAARVSLGMRPYDCQVLGALAMDDGHISEMRTGEGKTLTAVMPLYLNDGLEISKRPSSVHSLAMPELNRKIPYLCG